MFFVQLFVEISCLIFHVSTAALNPVYNTYSLARPSASSVLNVSANASYSLTSTSNLSLIDDPEIVCDGVKYGAGLDIGSCSDALDLIGLDDTQRNYGHRYIGDYDVNLPFRYLSRARAVPRNIQRLC